jgi:hypothetical protein
LLVIVQFMMVSVPLEAKIPPPAMDATGGIGCPLPFSIFSPASVTFALAPMVKTEPAAFPSMAVVPAPAPVMVRVSDLG